jgi:hypothetical protein
VSKCRGVGWKGKQSEKIFQFQQTSSPISIIDWSCCVNTLFTSNQLGERGRKGSFVEREGVETTQNIREDLKEVDDFNKENEN